MQYQNLPGSRGGFRAARLGMWVGALAIALSPAWGQQGSPPATRAEAGAASDSPIAVLLEAAGPDAREFNDHVTTLANPFFEGRVPGLRGNALAAEYIEYYYRRAGLAPAFTSEVAAADGTTVVDPGTTYRQPFAAGTMVKATTQRARLNLGGEGTVDLTPGEQFTVLGTSGNGKVTGPPVFVGYSIEEGNDDYTSYPGNVDLSGKIAIVLRFEPMTEAGKSKWTKGGWSPASDLNTKIAAAVEHKAAGVIVVNPPGADDPRANELTDAQNSRGKSAGVPVVMMQAAQVERLMKAADPTDMVRTLRDWRKAADEGGGVAELPNATVTLETAVAREPVKTDNVGAVLPGRGRLKDQYIVLGAHYDHVGYGPVGIEPSNAGKLHPGADDNASGTSALLVLAGKLAKTYDALPKNSDARSIMFVAFSAEESNLVGSRHFVAHPPPGVKLDQIDLMINMDMVGRLRSDPPMDVDGTNSAEGLLEQVAPHFEKSGIAIKHGPNVPTNSDHHSFYAKKIPILSFFTGYHKDYHRPGDVASRINQVGAAKVIALVHDITLDAARRSARLKFTDKKKEQEAAAADNPGPVHGTRVRFGAMPEYSDDGPGILVGGVSEGTSAEEAGIRVGDRMLKWNGKALGDAQAYTNLLGTFRPGDTVEILIERDGKEMTLKATLKAAVQGGR